MNKLAANLRVLAGAMQHTIRRRKGIGHLQTKDVAGLLDASATAIERRDRRIAKLQAIVRELRPEHKKGRTR